MKALDGKKTYLVVIGLVIGALAAYWQGDHGTAAILAGHAGVAAGLRKPLGKIQKALEAMEEK